MLKPHDRNPPPLYASTYWEMEKDKFINKVTGPHKELLDKKVNRNHTTIYFITFLKATPSNSVVYICRLLVLNPSSRFKTFLFILNGWSCGKLPILCKIKQIFLGHISCLFILFATPDFKAFLKTTTNSHRNKHLIARGHTTMKKTCSKIISKF